jgi:putative oxidoreductase
MEYLYKISMAHAAELLILGFLAITFLQSGYDKISDWKGNLSFLTDHFKETLFKNTVPFLLSIILIFEIVVGFLSIIGIVMIYVNQNTFMAYLACVLAAKVLLVLLFGQRVAKDYAGAMTIAVYFIVAIIGVILLK